MSDALGDMIETSARIADADLLPVFRHALEAAADSRASGNRAAFCTRIGLERSALSRWLTKSERPSLPQFLAVCYGVGTRPSEFLGLTISNSPKVHESNTVLRPMPRRPFDRAEVPRLNTNQRRRLEARLAAFSEKAPVPTLNAVCKSLGLRRSAAKYWFPSICQSIVDQRREIERTRRERRFAEGAKLVQRVIADLIDAEIPLSRRRVESKLKVHHRSLLEPQLRAAYQHAIGMLEPLAGLRTRRTEG